MKHATERHSGTYYPAFDYLRILLAAIVTAVHSHLIGWDWVGHYAVQVFFALSGWLIGGILLRSTIADLPRFYFNRSARIWIPYFAAIALLMAASLLKDDVTAKWLETFFYDVTFVFNFFGLPQIEAFRDAMPLQATGAHFWSICAEEQFYLLAPLLVILLPAVLGRSIMGWSLLAVAALASPFWGSFGAISLGVTAAVVRSHYGEWHTGRIAWLMLVGLVALIVAAISFGVVSYRIAAPFSSIGIVLALAQGGAPSPVASFLGGMSYPMYLNHWIGVFAANAVFGKLGLRDTLYCQLSGVIIAFFVAAILYVLIDRNVQRNRDRYFTKARGIAAASVGSALVVTGLLVGTVLALKAGALPSLLRL